ncbi:uncharacterized protein F4817DRAFT_297922 [Daldinia loculata]|uniref:uncharacterized protein n=1 Tax=Daldinia loculata TaxID=103429 RepID=UPI0020C2A2D6|nr:uncharacterized protein F4817DRAFT_297922 [Daldinia loculata]KAI1649887.1 hypothetical protein F4817DRAFT_297922 [Daldinia loculata]
MHLTYTCLLYMHVLKRQRIQILLNLLPLLPSACVYLHVYLVVRLTISHSPCMYVSTPFGHGVTQNASSQSFSVGKRWATSTKDSLIYIPLWSTVTFPPFLLFCSLYHILLPIAVIRFNISKEFQHPALIT